MANFYDFYYDILTSVFSPILPPNLPVVLAEFLIALIVTFVLVLPFKYLVNRTKLEEIKTQQKEKQGKIKELQKTNPQEATKMMNEILALNNSMFRINMKPLLITFVVAIAFLPWMGITFPNTVAQLPFPIPLIAADGKFGWLVWYIIISLPVNQLFRKLLNIP